MSTTIEPSVAARFDFEQQHDRNIRAEIERFRVKAQELLDGKITDDDFRSFRLRYGIYGQRQAGVQMVRTKIPSGVLTAKQTAALAGVSDEFAGGKAHTTTRQNIQFHFIPLDRCADIMHRLADVGMTSREACFNTVRNVTCDPISGLCRDEVFDPRPWAQKIAYALLRKQLTDNLPRKFKIVFTGRESDRMLGAIHDVGLQAAIKDGKKGFRMVVGGGLGPMPAEAQILDEFLPEERLLNRIEAVIRVFNKYGNRQNRNKARLKFVVRDRGFDWTREQIEKEYADILANGGIETPEMVPEGFGGFQSNPKPLGNGSLLPVLNAAPTGDANYDRWLETNVTEQKQTGYAIVTVRIDQGNLTSNQLRALAGISASAGDSLVRVNIDQNILLAWIPLAWLPRVYTALGEAGLNAAGAREISDVTTCPGAYSCNLALTKAMNLGAALQDVVGVYDDPHVRKLSIKVSGCPNSCGQHWVSDFGFYGNARKIGGKEVPYYLMLLGGGYDAKGIMRFGIAVQAVPARLAPEAVKRVLDHYLVNRVDGESFRDYVLRHKVQLFRERTADLAKPAEMFPEIYQDWGDSEAFSLQLGRGECAA
jgi:sulfite reductase beta subunit-like hemoprotein